MSSEGPKLVRQFWLAHAPLTNAWLSTVAAVVPILGSAIYIYPWSVKP